MQFRHFKKVWQAAKVTGQIGSFIHSIWLIGLFSVWLFAHLSCETSQQTLPAPVPAKALYKFLSDEQAKNPTRLEKRVDSEQLVGITDTIGKIEGSTIQFTIKEEMWAKDAYIECDFEDSDNVTMLNKGDQVTVYGKFHKAFPTGKLGDFGFKDNKAVKFRDCWLSAIH